jgi:acyl carrier protein
MSNEFLASTLDAFETVLKVTVQPDDNFFDLGGDSLASEALLTLLSEQVEVDLPGWTLLDHPRPIDLAAFLARLKAEN